MSPRTNQGMFMATTFRSVCGPELHVTALAGCCETLEPLSTEMVDVTTVGTQECVCRAAYGILPPFIMMRAGR